MKFTWILKIIFAERRGMGMDEQMGKGDGEIEGKSNWAIEA